MEQLLYVAVKFLAYVLWCGLGVRLFRPQSASRVAAAFKFGVVRLLLGVVLGVTVFLSAGMLHVDRWGLSHLATYLAMYVPLRWVEWSIMGYLLQPGTTSLLIAPRLSSNQKDSALAGAISPRSSSRAAGLWWKIGGIVVSHLADLPIIIAAGGIQEMLPIGRFLC